MQRRPLECHLDPCFLTLFMSHSRLVERSEPPAPDVLWQISNIACLILGFGMLYGAFFWPEASNARKALSIYSALCVFRAISFLITSLPAPCGGLAKCPCADPEQLQLLHNARSMTVGLKWLASLGIFPCGYPQCGDLIVSGHTMLLWGGWLMLSEIIDIKIRPPFNLLIERTILSLVLASMFYIIISRNHYSVDVWFGWMLSLYLFTTYSYCQQLAKQPCSSRDALLVRIIRWLETRDVPLRDPFGPNLWRRGRQARSEGSLLM